MDYTEMGIANALMAIDQADCGAYDSMEHAIDAHRQNVVDTVREYGGNLIQRSEALAAFETSIADGLFEQVATLRKLGKLDAQSGRCTYGRNEFTDKWSETKRREYMDAYDSAAGIASHKD